MLNSTIITTTIYRNYFVIHTMGKTDFRTMSEPERLAFRKQAIRLGRPKKEITILRRRVNSYAFKQN